MITANSTGKKNRIIGTVSFGGNAAAFFSAALIAFLAAFIGDDAEGLTESVP